MTNNDLLNRSQLKFARKPNYIKSSKPISLPILIALLIPTHQFILEHPTRCQKNDQTILSSGIAAFSITATTEQSTRAKKIMRETFHRLGPITDCEYRSDSVKLRNLSARHSTKQTVPSNMS